MTWLAIIAATFVSEDLTLIAVGLLVSQGHLPLPQALLVCFGGLLLGDVSLWLLGRGAGMGLSRLQWVQRRVPGHEMNRLSTSLHRHAFKVILAARFVPGLRFPVYVGAGVLGYSGWRFTLATTLACAIWVPLLVVSVSWIGEPAADAFHHMLGSTWLSLIALALLSLLLLRGFEMMLSARLRARLWATLSRLWRWEFWPSWLFYLPMIPWLLWLGLRYRGLTLPTLSNPGIPHSGIVGESKWHILQQLPAAWIVPTHLLPTGEPAQRLSHLQNLLTTSQWTLPIILKPDAGERGSAVRLIRSFDQALNYFQQVRVPVLAQQYHPGPYEAGIFYYRLPDQPRGQIFSITDKHFPILVGDGVHTFEDLILLHPRYRMQADRFFARFAEQLQSVPAAGQSIALAMAGNHCQGTCFRDGAHLITPALQNTIDQIAQHFVGFYFGRFDVRYRDPQEFMAGQDFQIIELNGVTSESTNLYDPTWSIFRAWAVLAAQLHLAYRIGAANRRTGLRPTPLGVLYRDIRHHLRLRDLPTLSD